MIVARMFGMRKPDNYVNELFDNDRTGEPKIFSSATEATKYLKNEGYLVDNLFVSNAIKGGDVKADISANKYSITKKDLLVHVKKQKVKNERLTNDALLRKYSKRHHIDKVLRELELTWGLNLLASKGMRGFRVSFKTDLEDLAVINEKKKKQTKSEMLKERKKQAIENAKKIVHNQEKSN